VARCELTRNHPSLQMPAWRKLELVGDMNEAVRTLALAGLRQRYPNDTPAQTPQAAGGPPARARTGGARLRVSAEGDVMFAEFISVALRVADALGSSLSSAVHGVMRATMDADVVADLRLTHVEPLAHTLGTAFYTDVHMIRDAVRRHTSFNVIHLETMFKVDVFVAKPRAFDRAQLARREWVILSEEPERGACVTSAEDIVLAMLEWFRAGGEVPDRQWRDVLGVLKVQDERLDLDYLRQMAAELRVSELLERALREAGSGGC